MSDIYKSIPKSVRVGCYKYVIKVTKEDLMTAKGLFGQCNNTINEIQVSASLTNMQAANTLMHEILHAIHWCYGVNDESTEEENTNLTANGLCAFWQDNANAVEWFSKVMKAAHK